MVDRLIAAAKVPAGRRADHEIARALRKRHSSELYHSVRISRAFGPLAGRRVAEVFERIDAQWVALVRTVRDSTLAQSDFGSIRAASHLDGAVR